ncbi:putative inactive purple acid phosphatase [Paramyrothecium foliicola]|nr:putative inactive purple acid phosphatase [Paramyrothecium foliicola]
MMRVVVAVAVLFGLSHQAAVHRQIGTDNAIPGDTPNSEPGSPELINTEPIGPEPGSLQTDPNLLKFNDDGTFQIAIFSDLHFGENAWDPWGPQQDINTVKVLNKVLDFDRPNLVVLNGDLITGENAYLDNSTAVVDQMVEPMVSRGLPWASTYGNHDSQYDLSPEAILEREHMFPGARTRRMVWSREAGVTNYYLPVYAPECADCSCAPELILWFFDSRGGFYFQERNGDGSHVGRPNWVDFSVVNWFRETNAKLVAKHGKAIPSLAFVHIPTHASRVFQETGVHPNRQPGINDDNPLADQAQGWCPDGRNDGSCQYGGQDIPFMQALTETPGLMGLFSGHDHGDTWCYKWDALLPGMTVAGNGVNLCFGQHSGYGGYGNWIRGAREVRVSREALKDLAFQSWIRLESGDVVGDVSLNATYNRDWYPATPNDKTRDLPRRKVKMTITTSACALLAVAGLVHARAGTPLDPVQPIRLPDGAQAKNPLAHLGGNGPWTAAGDVTGISSEIPEGCVVDQAAYVLRHGSRYPDTGAHGGWVNMAQRFKQSSYTATGPLAFVHNWDTPLERPDIQIAQLSRTGYKELHDLGYSLRTRYPDLYNEGDEFFVWANNYTRVLQTAQMFVQGYLGPNATTLGKIVSITNKGFIGQLGNTLAPSDMCPTFKDDSSVQTAAWRSKWLPSFIERLSQYIDGDLKLDDSQWNDFPYICGFESQITGRLSPFCDTFTQEELEAYEYLQDLRYYYGVGPGADVASKMMVPFLSSLVDRFVEGPVAEGKRPDGSSFKLPKLLMNFLNDGQLNQLATAIGVFDEQEPLPTDRIPEDRLWINSRISPMRGTIAFERLTCRASNGTTPVDPQPTSTPVWSTVSGTSCIVRPTATPSPAPKEESFIRIRINEAVYPVPSCQDGPGKSCGVKKYAKYVSDKLEAQGSFTKICNVTDPAAPTKVLGAGFLTDLSAEHLQIISP